MSSFFSDPYLLIFAAITSISILFVVVYLTKSKNHQLVFQKITIYSLLSVVSGVAIFPFSRLHPAEIGHPEKTLLSGLTLVCVYTLCLILLKVPFKKIVNTIVILFKQKFLGIYFAIVIFSTFWSSNPLVTFRGTVGLICLSAFAVYFGRQYNWEELFRLLRWSQIIIIITSAFTSWFIPSIGVHEKGWQGILGYPIDLGNMMALCASLWLLNFVREPRYRIRSLIFLSFSIVVMQLANSAGAFVLFVGLIFIISIAPMFRKLNFAQANFLFATFLLVFMLGSFWLTSSYEQILSALNKDVTLTGRMPLWQMLIDDYISKRPWFGYGYGIFWAELPGTDSVSLGIRRIIGDWAVHAHNGFLDIILSVGFAGCLMFILSFINSIKRAIALFILESKLDSILPLIILAFVFFGNISHSTIVFPSYIWFLYVLVTVRLQTDILEKRQEDRLLKANEVKALLHSI
jgi:exopolysaccharide production protein ExoQ